MVEEHIKQREEEGASSPELLSVDDSDHEDVCEPELGVTQHPPQEANVRRVQNATFPTVGEWTGVTSLGAVATITTYKFHYPMYNGNRTEIRRMIYRVRSIIPETMPSGLTGSTSYVWDPTWVKWVPPSGIYPNNVWGHVLIYAPSGTTAGQFFSRARYSAGQYSIDILECQDPVEFHIGWV